MLAQMDLNGNPFIGVFCAVNDNFSFLPKNITKKEISKIKKVLDVKTINISIDSSPLIGAMVAFNSSGIIVPNLISKEELKKFKNNFQIQQLSEKLNAFGNNILVNDKAALVHPKFKPDSLKIIQDILDVEVLKGTIAGIKTVGSAAVVTNNGVLCHPKASEEELDNLKNLFNIHIAIGTVNFGMPMIGAGLIANGKGAITGTKTTGVELNRIEDALGLL